MRELLIVLGTTIGALAIVAGAVLGVGDASMFVPPSAAAEGFARRLAAGRYDLARRQLAAGARVRETPEVLARRFEPVRERIGTVEYAEPIDLWRSGDRAAAACEIEGEHASVSLTVAFTRERGVWMVERWETTGVTTR